MALKTESPIIILSEPGEWGKFSDNGRLFYADPVIYPMNAPICEVYSLLNDLDVRGLDVRAPSNNEFNIMASDPRHPEIAEQMREYLIPTGVLKNVRKRWLCPGYRASYIEKPEFIKRKRGFKVAGSKEKIKLPPEGFFDISKLENETSLPGMTYDMYEELQDEPWAYFLIEKGQEMVLLRGCTRNQPSKGVKRKLEQQNEFAFTIFYHLEKIIQNLGLLAVSDQDPRPKPKEKKTKEN